MQPRFLLAAASDITRSDVDLAFASDGIILGFNIEPSEAALAHAKQYGEPSASAREPSDTYDTHKSQNILESTQAQEAISLN